MIQHYIAIDTKQVFLGAMCEGYVQFAVLKFIQMCYNSNFSFNFWNILLYLGYQNKQRTSETSVAYLLKV